MAQNKHSRLAEQAAEHHGVFTTNNALEAGFSPSTLSNGVAEGRYRQLWPSVYAIAGSPSSVYQQMVAVVLSLPGIAAVSHRTAAELWHMTNRGIRAVDVVTTRWDRVKRPGISVHESLDLVPADVACIDGIPVTTAQRTVVDLGAVDRWSVERAFEAGIRRSHFDAGDVERVVRRVARKGRRGVGVIRPLLEQRKQWDAATESALEDRFLRVVLDRGLPQPTPQYVVRDDMDRFVCRADFAYPQTRLLIELDSEAHHMDRITFRRDRSKQNRATVLGWTVLRYTWWDVENYPYRIESEIAASLLSASSN